MVRPDERVVGGGSFGGSVSEKEVEVGDSDEGEGVLCPLGFSRRIMVENLCSFLAGSGEDGLWGVTAVELLRLGM